VRAVAIAALALALAGCGGGSSSSCPSFAQIVGGDFGRTGDMLWWTLEVAALPPTLTFNQEKVPAYVLEYIWAVELDSDRNGDTDLRVALTHLREPNAAETVSDILSVSSADLWNVSGAISSTIRSIDASIGGSTIRFETDVSADSKLAAITDRDQATWTTSYQNGPLVGCRDRWP
jgi:hypothetical protein